jgi:hypothetical protein
VLIQISYLISSLAMLAWAYVAWVLVRGIDLGPGPRVASRVAAIAAGLLALRATLDILSIAASAWVSSLPSDAYFDTIPPWQSIFMTAAIGGAWVSVAASAFFVGAFALGIHDDGSSARDEPLDGPAVQR